MVVFVVLCEDDQPADDNGDNEEGELVNPESDEDEDDDDVLTTVGDDLSTSTMARDAANSMGVTRKETRQGPSRGTKNTDSQGRKRTGTQKDGSQPAKRPATSELLLLVSWCDGCST